MKYFLKVYSVPSVNSVVKILGVFAFVLVVALGCHKSKTGLKDLPLPPTVDSGVVNGQFVQVDYGFGFPVPSKWIYTPVSAEQEVDEVARFFDPGREMIVRVSVQLRDASQKFNGKVWSELAEQDLKSHQFQITKKDSAQERKTAGSEKWLMVSFKMNDVKGAEWADEEWALAKDDYLIAVHATLPGSTAATERGKKLFNAFGDSLSRITWYMPIGIRGISSDRFELEHFTEEFCKALESKSVVQVGSYFDEMYPNKIEWNNWYQQVIAGNPKAFDVQAQLSGLVINGDYATASFGLIRTNKDDSKPQKFERNFKLAKKDGLWKITLSLDKDSEPSNIVNHQDASPKSGNQAPSKTKK